MKHSELNGKVMRLENGLEKLRTTAIQVDDLKEKLAVQVKCTTVEPRFNGPVSNEILSITDANLPVFFNFLCCL